MHLHCSHSFIGFGLSIHSEIPLPELVPSIGTFQDVTIRKGKVFKAPPPVDSQGMHFRRHEDEIFMFWESVGGFLIRGGRDIIVDSLPGTEEELLRVPLLGPVLGNLLFQRGYLVLHASAVVIGDQVTAFMGSAGSGKSTTAGALHARGHTVVTDDVLAIGFGATGRPHILPAYPQLKLWPDAAAAAFGDDPEQLKRIHKRVPKLGRRAEKGFRTNTFPLGLIYVLDRGEELTTESISSKDAFIELLRNAYCLQLMEDKQFASAAFPRMAQLLNHVPLERLRRKADLPDLGRMAEAIEARVEEHRLKHAPHYLQAV